MILIFICVLIWLSEFLVKKMATHWKITFKGDRLFVEQSLRIFIVFVIMIVLKSLGYLKPTFLSSGDFFAKATPHLLLGIKENETWLSVGLIFLFIISTTTFFAIYLPIRRSISFSLLKSPAIVGAILILALVNASIEELLYRVIPLGLTGFKLTDLAWYSAVLFGIPHYFGYPRRWIGVFLAGFLGWFLASSVIDTGGIAWALIIHFAQDVIIIGLLLSSTVESPFTLANFKNNNHVLRVALGQFLFLSAVICTI